MANNSQARKDGERPGKQTCIILMVITVLLFVPSIASAQGPVFPLKASANHRYLVDQNGAPVLVAAHGSFDNTISNASLAQWTTFLGTIRSLGFNAVWLWDLCRAETGCHDSLAAYDSTLPFTSGTSHTNYDISTPNSAYWTQLDTLINTAASYGILVIFDAWDTSGLQLLGENSGTTKMYGFGQFLGNRYKNFPNIVWMMGNDFQTWKTGIVDGTSNSTIASEDNNAAKNLMAGITATDPNHLQTIEMNYNISKSSDDTLLSPYVTIGSTYTYYPVYGMGYAQYNAEAKPYWLVESYWEGGFYGLLTPSVATNKMLRSQAYWTVLAGGSGYMYGLNGANPSTNLSTTAAKQVGIWKNFFSSLAWYNLVPDQSHTVVTAGYGTESGTDSGGGHGVGNEQTDNYVTTARSSDGSLLISYCPLSCVLTVDMTKLAGSATARWFDPTNNAYQTISGSPLANTGTHSFSSPGNNSGGDPDWVLVLNTSALPPPPTKLTATAH